MIAFLIKSILCLGILYAVYLVLLRNLKTFAFNRYFLLGSLLFSIIIPLIHVPVDFNGGITTNIESIKSMTATIVQVDENISEFQNQNSSSFLLLPIIYGTISLLLLIRFLVNLVRIRKTIVCNEIVSKQDYKLVLVPTQTLPYSFFDYIFLNKKDFEMDVINLALLQHELAHCAQKHSFDIILLEIAKIFLWINPFIWMMKKSVQLNHEYLADFESVSEGSIKNYQELLYETAFNNNAGILTSNFSLSLTKQRLMMLTKNFSSKKAIINYLTSFIIILLLGIIISFSQKTLKFKVSLDGSKKNYAGMILRPSEFGVIEITTNYKDYQVGLFELTLARGNRPIEVNSDIRGSSFDVSKYSGIARSGDRFVIQIMELVPIIDDKGMEPGTQQNLRQQSSKIELPFDRSLIITIPIEAK